MLRSILKDGLWSFAIRMFGVLGTLIIQALLARLLPKEEMGAYYLLFSLVTFGALVARFGMRQTVVKFVAESLALGQGARLRKALRFILYTVTVGVLAVLFISYGFALPLVLDRVFSISVEPLAYLVLGLWMTLLAYQTVVSETFRGLHKVRKATFIEGPAGNLLLLLLLLILITAQSRYGGSISLTWVITLTCAALTANIIWHTYQLLRSVGLVEGEGTVSSREILSLAAPIYVTNLVVYVLGDASLWIAGAYLPSTEVAEYGVALKLILLVTLPLSVVNLVVQPKVSKFVAEEKMTEMETMLRGTASLATVVSLAIVLVIIIAPEFVLTLVFGSEYSGASHILVILAVGRFVHVWAGSCGNVLMLTGHQKDLMYISVSVGVLVIIASLTLVNYWGAEGIAVSAAAGWAAQNILSVRKVKKRTGIQTQADLMPSSLKYYAGLLK